MSSRFSKGGEKALSSTIQWNLVAFNSELAPGSVIQTGSSGRNGFCCATFLLLHLSCPARGSPGKWAPIYELQERIRNWIFVALTDCTRVLFVLLHASCPCESASRPPRNKEGLKRELRLSTCVKKHVRHEFVFVCQCWDRLRAPLRGWCYLYLNHEIDACGEVGDSWIMQQGISWKWWCRHVCVCGTSVQGNMSGGFLWLENV